MQARVGGILKGFTVYRKNGTVERYDTPLHNVISNSHLLETVLLRSSGDDTSLTGTRSIAISTVKCITPMVGSYTMGAGTSTTFTRVSGDIGPSGGAILLGNGNFAYSVSGTTTRTLSKTGAQFDITGQNIYHVKCDTMTGITQTGSTSTRTTTFVDGVITSVNDSAFILTSTAVQTINSIVFRTSTGTSASVFNAFDLASPLSLGIGDIVGVNAGDFYVTYTIDDYAAQTFTAGTCPIAGISQSGKFQRLIPVWNSSTPGGILDIFETLWQNTAIVTRIWLINDANKIIVPSLMPATAYPESTITSALETITASSSYNTPTATSNFSSYRDYWGTVLTGGSVKQIIVGSPSSSRNKLAAVIEFDSPVTIPAGKILYFKHEMTITPDMPILG